MPEPPRDPRCCCVHEVKENEGKTLAFQRRELWIFNLDSSAAVSGLLVRPVYPA
jgi:hypothetical protein